MNIEHDEQVQLDDFVEYLMEQTISRLPDTIMGRKL